ncbi:DgyrCDS13945 [Dimorphilus gyrociliatus]|uniref:DgyrCDS13945 n=1 Tax=Dimorphilus gyrociliatus TaxID=2664684 RepID=A0A7I8WC67_9ANNE|nr:DgyrCDS13945 [Dimorphilus gyrociliatus]
MAELATVAMHVDSREKSSPHRSRKMNFACKKLFTSASRALLVRKNLKDLPLKTFSTEILQPKAQKETITINFMKNGSKIPAKAKVGDHLLDVVIDNDIDLDGFGACEGTLSCSTCHLIFTDEQFKIIGTKPTDEELDMLDLAYDLVDTSRLGCQVFVTKEMNGWEIEVPAGVSDARDV